MAQVVGEALEFGVPADEASLVTQSVSKTSKVDKKEVRDRQGKVVAVAFYNKMDEISIEGVGTYGSAPGTSLSLSGVTAVGAVYVEEVAEEYQNEEFVKTSIKATAWEGIS